MPEPQRGLARLPPGFPPNPKLAEGSCSPHPSPAPPWDSLGKQSTRSCRLAQPGARHHPRHTGPAQGSLPAEHRSLMLVHPRGPGRHQSTASSRLRCCRRGRRRLLCWHGSCSTYVTSASSAAPAQAVPAGTGHVRVGFGREQESSTWGRATQCKHGTREGFRAAGCPPWSHPPAHQRTRDVPISLNQPLPPHSLPLVCLSKELPPLKWSRSNHRASLRSIVLTTSCALPCMEQAGHQHLVG